MGYQTTIANDYKVPANDEGEAATLTSNPAGTTTALTKVTTSSLDVVEATGSSGYFKEDGMAFVFGANQVTTATRPEPGDKITRTADSVVWEIIDARLVSLDTKWRCTCKRDR